jgi:hypothetical protein
MQKSLITPIMKRLHGLQIHSRIKRNLWDPFFKCFWVGEALASVFKVTEIASTPRD